MFYAPNFDDNFGFDRVMAVFAVVFWILIKKAMLEKSDDKSNDRTALMLQDQLKEMRDAIHKTNLDIRNTLDNRIGSLPKRCNRRSAIPPK